MVVFFRSTVRHMYARHRRSGLLELELADFKQARRYRIMAFDKVNKQTPTNYKFSKKCYIFG